MKGILCFLTIIGLSLALSEGQNEFSNFKAKFNKVYSPREELMRKNTFLQNVEKINAHNARFEAGLETFTVKITKFADLTPEEFKAKRLGSHGKKIDGVKVTVYEPPQEFEIPESFDWRSANPLVVGEVKDQGDCGSCWTFSTTGPLEGRYALQYNETISLSEQNLIDCNKKHDQGGCDGGDMVPAFEYVLENGIELEADYAYKGRDQSCKFNSEKSVLNVKEIFHLKPRVVEHLKMAVVNEGPISIGIDGGNPLFQWYDSGVFHTETCVTKSSELDHAVSVIGFGKTDDGSEYWIIRNSWSSDWGEDGFMRIAIATNDCGVTSDSAFATLV